MLGDRGVGPVVGIVLLVAIVVILAASVATFTLSLGGDIDDPAPVIGQSSGNLEPVDGGGGGIVTISHVAGDSVPASELEIVVDATDACDKEARLVNLPAPSPNPDNHQYKDENIAGDEGLLAKGHIEHLGQEPWDGGVLLEDNDNTFEPGTSFEFRIKSGGCDSLDEGDTVAVHVVHLPTDSILIDKQFTA